MMEEWISRQPDCAFVSEDSLRGSLAADLLQKQRGTAVATAPWPAGLPKVGAVRTYP